jgi:hypothetical protein
MPRQGDIAAQKVWFASPKISKPDARTKASRMTRDIAGPEIAFPSPRCNKTAQNQH